MTLRCGEWFSSALPLEYSFAFVVQEDAAGAAPSSQLLPRFAPPACCPTCLLSAAWLATRLLSHLGSLIVCVVRAGGFDGSVAVWSAKAYARQSICSTLGRWESLVCNLA